MYQLWQVDWAELVGRGIDQTLSERGVEPSSDTMSKVFPQFIMLLLIKHTYKYKDVVIIGFKFQGLMSLPILMIQISSIYIIHQIPKDEVSNKYEPRPFN